MSKTKSSLNSQIDSEESEEVTLLFNGNNKHKLNVCVLFEQSGELHNWFKLQIILGGISNHSMKLLFARLQSVIIFQSNLFLFLSGILV